MCLLSKTNSFLKQAIAGNTINVLKNRIDTLQEQLDAKTSTNEKLDQPQANAKAELLALNKQISDLKDEVATLSLKVQDDDQRFVELRDANISVSQKFNSSLQELAKLREVSVELGQKLNNSLATVDELRAQLVEKERQLQELLPYKQTKDYDDFVAKLVGDVKNSHHTLHVNITQRQNGFYCAVYKARDRMLVGKDCEALIIHNPEAFNSDLLSIRTNLVGCKDAYIVILPKDSLIAQSIKQRKVLTQTIDLSGLAIRKIVQGN